nr:MAG TPA: hypothetical protein [Caudoviricetes sp.]
MTIGMHVHPLRCSKLCTPLRGEQQATIICVIG